MNDKPEYVYIMYPVPIEKIKNMELLPVNPVPIDADEESFVPLWYGNACFPEDEV